MYHHRMKPAGLVVLLAMLASSPPAIAALAGKAGDSNCSLWNIREFFSDATSSEVSECLKRGADPDAREKQGGGTPLHIGANQGRIEVVRALLGAGANVNARERDGWTPLHYAAIRGHTGIAKTLIAAGAGVNAKEEDGWTPLHFASNKPAKALLRRPAQRGHPFRYQAARHP